VLEDAERRMARERPGRVNELPNRAELVLVDDADRLKFPVLEQLRIPTTGAVPASC
jgi:hypothetical protein